MKKTLSLLTFAFVLFFSQISVSMASADTYLSLIKAGDHKFSTAFVPQKIAVKTTETAAKIIKELLNLK